MKILLTGATGYIGKRLLPILVDNGYDVVCCVRDAKRFSPPKSIVPHIEVIEVDLLEEASLTNIPKDIDGAYYLAHSMSYSDNYEITEKISAINFREALNKTKVKHVVYLGNFVKENHLSKHLSSRRNVEIELVKGDYKFTSLRAGMIIGSGSASFEIIRDLVEKLPIMIAPSWVNTKCQPVGVSDVMKFLTKTLFTPETYDKSFDIGGPDIITYKEMLLGFAKARNLKRRIFITPVKTFKFSPYWLAFVTSISYKLATLLVESLKEESVAKANDLNEILDIQPIRYNEVLAKALAKIEGNEIVSSWKDPLVSGRLNMNISDFINVPSYGCFTDIRVSQVSNREVSIDRIWRIGGNTGWYYATWLWRIRGLMDKVTGGVGMKRGRTHEDNLVAGDVVDVWRVLYSDKTEGRLLLFAEMKLPGEAWLEFRISDDKLIQKATFRPKGIKGRIYWYSLVPFHLFIFKGMINKLTGK